MCFRVPPFQCLTMLVIDGITIVASSFTANFLAPASSGHTRRCASPVK